MLSGMDTPIRDMVLERHANHLNPCLAFQVACEAQKKDSHYDYEITQARLDKRALQAEIVRLEGVVEALNQYCMKLLDRNVGTPD